MVVDIIVHRHYISRNSVRLTPDFSTSQLTRSNAVIQLSWQKFSLIVGTTVSFFVLFFFCVERRDESNVVSAGGPSFRAQGFL